MRQIGGVEQNLILACKRKGEEQAWEDRDFVVLD
jgi:hypothetical protein